MSRLLEKISGASARLLAALADSDGLVGYKRNELTGVIENKAGEAVIGYDSKLKRVRDYLSSNYGIRIATVGDSILAQGVSALSKVVSEISPLGFVGHMQSISMGAIRVGSCYGYPGQATDFIHARLAENLNTIPEKVIIYFPGANNIKSTTLTAQQLYDKIAAGADLIEAAGKIPVLCTIFPMSQSNGAYDNSLRLGTNDLLRAGAAEGRFVLIDWAGLYEKADGAIDSTRVTYDGVHPAQNTAERGAILALGVMLPEYKSAFNRLTQLTKTSKYFDLSKQTGASGTVTAPATGQVFTGCYLSVNGAGASAVGAIVSASIDDHDPADWQQITVTAGASAIAYGQVSVFANNVYPGVRQCFVEVEFDSPTDDAIISVGARLLTKGNIQGVRCMWADVTTAQYSGNRRRRLLITPPFETSGDQASEAPFIVRIGVAPSKTATLRLRRIGDMPAGWSYPGSANLPAS